MPLRLSPLLIMLAAAPLVAQQNVQDFQLPPAPAETGAPVQGPVDPDAPFVTAPRAVNTPRPTPMPRPSPSPTPGVQATPTPVPTQGAQPRTNPGPGQTAPLRPASLPSPALEPVETEAVSGEDQAIIPTLPIPAPSATAIPEVAAQEAGASRLAIPEWALAALVALFALLGGIVWLTHRRRNVPPPKIERPVIADKGSAEAAPPNGYDTLMIKAEAIKLSRSMMNATLHYRLSVTNRSNVALNAVAIGGDLVSAHNRKPVDQQIADPARVLAARHEIQRLSPGQTVNLDGTLQLPLSQVHPIRQGNSPLFVPLMRWRASSEAIEPVARTYVVGSQPQFAGGRLQPFRLDEQPQTYSQIGQRAID